jgi:polysaccharide biosynthesis transport protein
MNLTEPTATFLNPAPTPENRIQLYEILWRRKWLILLTAFVGLAIGYWYYLEAPRVYRSTSLLLIKERQTAPVVSKEMQLVSGDKMETQLQVIASQSVLSKAAVNEELKKVSREAFGVEDDAASLESGLSAEIVKNSDAMEVSFRSGNKNHARVALQAIVQAYESALRDSYEDVGLETAELIKSASDTLEKKIIDKRNEYAEFRKQNSTQLLVVNGEPTNVHAKRLAELSTQHNSLRTKKITIESELEVLKQSIAANGIDESMALDILAKLDQLTGGAILKQRETELADTKPEIRLLTELLLSEKSLSAKYGDEHPEVKDLREKIDLLMEMNAKLEADNKEQIAADAAKRGIGRTPVQAPQTPEECVNLYTGMLTRDLDRISNELTVINREIEDAKKQTQTLDAILVADVNYREAIKQSETLNSEILARLDEIDIVKESGGTRAMTLTPPSTARQVFPVLLQVLAIGGIIGALVGAGIGNLLDMGESTFRSPADVVRSLDLPILGQVPSIESRRVKRATKLTKIPQTIIAAHQPSSSVAESFRAIRTSLYFSAEGKGSQVIQITSPTPGDGKSTLSANLAVSIAKSGKRVLLIDADFRRPTQHRVFGINNDVGLATLLANSSETPVTPTETEIADLFLMPSGPGVSNPSELLSGVRMGEAIEAFRNDYDFVIIDTPPVLAVTDPLAVAARTDGVIMALRIARGVQFSSKRAKEALDRVGANILGIVVNGYARNSTFARGVAKDYGYSNGYGYGYGYGYSRNPYADPYSRREGQSSQRGACPPSMRSRRLQVRGRRRNGPEFVPARKLANCHCDFLTIQCQALGPTWRQFVQEWLRRDG